MEKYEKNGPFSGRLRPVWGNTTRAATAGLGSKGITMIRKTYMYILRIMRENLKSSGKVKLRYKFSNLTKT